MPAPTLPEPPGTFSSSTTVETCHGLPSVRIWIQQSTCGTKSKEYSMKCGQVYFFLGYGPRFQRPLSLISRLIHSMYRRSVSLVRAHVGHTHNAPTDACDTICTGNFEETLVKMCAKILLSPIIPLGYLISNWRFFCGSVHIYFVLVFLWFALFGKLLDLLFCWIFIFFHAFYFWGRGLLVLFVMFVRCLFFVCCCFWLSWGFFAGVWAIMTKCK